MMELFIDKKIVADDPGDSIIKRHAVQPLNASNWRQHRSILCGHIVFYGFWAPNGAVSPAMHPANYQISMMNKG